MKIFLFFDVRDSLLKCVQEFQIHTHTHTHTHTDTLKGAD